VIVPSVFWYLAAIPSTILTTAKLAMPIPMLAKSIMWWLTGVLAVIVILFGLLIPKTYHFVIGIVALALGLTWFGSYEWFRESVRKPYVISGYMYANSLDLIHAKEYQTDGMLAFMKFRTGDDGRDLFNRSCRSCHTMSGYNALKPRFNGTDSAFVSAMVAGIGAMRGHMPPWLGTPAEADLVGAHIYAQTDHRPLGEIYGLSGVELGRKVYDIRCGNCHVLGGYDDKTASLAGLSDSDYNDMLDMADDLGDEMPAFTASAAERAALIEFFKTLKTGGGK